MITTPEFSQDARDYVQRIEKKIVLIDGRQLVQFNHIHAAANLSDLGTIPGNRLEALAGDRKGQYSIRINDQWRICFSWVNADALDVEIADCH